MLMRFDIITRAISSLISTLPETVEQVVSRKRKSDRHAEWETKNTPASVIR